MSNCNLKSLFEPQNIAIIGASHNPDKIGYQIVENIVKGEFQGNIYPINPKGGKVAGVSAFSSIHEVLDEIDIAIITIPAVHVFDAVKSCTMKHVKNTIIITSGFSEIGNNSEEKRIVNLARENNMRVLGPNVFGIYSSKVKLNATFGPKDIKLGNVSIITQSGAIGIAMTGKTKTENIGLSSIISVGNKSDIDEIDLLEYLIDDDETQTILMYIEGIKGGSKLVNTFERAARKKPIVVIKSGRSARGAMAAASHTGSLAGADEVFNDIIKQCGIIRAETIEEALDWCKFLSNAPLPKGENTVIITNGGGIGVLAADACEKYGITLYDDTKLLEKNFSGVVPNFGSTKNPIDLTGAATANDYDKALSTALKNNNIDSVICLGCETAVFDADEFTSTVEKQFEAYKNSKPVVFSIFGGEAIENSISKLRKGSTPIFSDVYDAVACLGALSQYSCNIKKTKKEEAIPEINTQAIQEIINNVKSDNRHFLLAKEAQAIMNIVDIKIPKSYVAKNIDEAIKFAELIGYPLVMKVVSKDIIHKSDSGGIALNLENKTEVIEAFESIINNCKNYKPDAHIEGIEIAEMVHSGIETIVGARVDPSFGPTVMFGLGGVYVEVMKDVSFRAFPLNKDAISGMISEIKSYPLLLGVRGDEKKDIEEVANTILKIGSILYSCPDISDIEVNPLIVYDQGKGVKAVDIRIILASET